MKRVDERNKGSGFTIVELLIVIVVIAVLATISIVAYNGIQSRARDTKIQSDLSQMETAIVAARVNQGTSLWGITNNGWTADDCASLANGADLTATPDCLAAYDSFLATVSAASGIDVNGMKDPWGRPYYIDENEDQDHSGQCNKDVIAVYNYPHTTNGFTAPRLISNSLPACI